MKKISYQLPSLIILAVGIGMRGMFICAIALYVLAKTTEMHDLAILQQLGWISGHSLKHLFAAGAGLLIVFVLRVDAVK